MFKMPKKPSKNSFFFFMLQQYHSFKENGIHFKNGFKDPELVQMASDKWKLLSREEKCAFERLAKAAKEESKFESNLGKLDCFGNLISERENLEEDSLRRRKRFCLILRERFQKLKDKSKIMTEKFYFIHFEVFCETDEGEILPCEVAVIKYSLKDGIENEFHAFIDPGSIPMGYMCECMTASESTHKIPVKKFELASSDYQSIFDGIQDIVDDTDLDLESCVFFSSCSAIPEVEKCLNWLGSKSGYRNPENWNICEAEILFQELQRFGGQELTRGIVITKLNSAVYDYEPNTRCTWHEEQEVKYCALGHIKRICFQISEHTCSLYDCTLTKHHLPERIEVPQLDFPITPIATFSRGLRLSSSNQQSDMETAVKTATHSIDQTSVPNFFFSTNDSEEIEEKSVLKPLRLPKTKGQIEMLSMKAAARMYGKSLGKADETNNSSLDLNISTNSAVLAKPKLDKSEEKAEPSTNSNSLGPPGFFSRLPTPDCAQVTSLRMPSMPQLPRGIRGPSISMPSPATIRSPLAMMRFANPINVSVGTGDASHTLINSMRLPSCGRASLIQNPSSDFPAKRLFRGRGVLMGDFTSAADVKSMLNRLSTKDQ